MTVGEFEKEFDIIYENISKGGAPGLLPYEKSVILTSAAEKVAESLITTDVSLISNLILAVEVAAVVPGGAYEKLNPNSFTFQLPGSYLKILNEVAKDASAEYVIVPLSSLEYDLRMKKAYRYPARRTAWRLENSLTTTEYVEIVARSGITLTNYRVRYVRLPGPIILQLLTSDTIRGISAQTECDLNDALHPKVLEVATKLAEFYYLDKYGNESGNNK